MDDIQLQQRAQAATDAKLKFYTHAASYACIAAFLMALDWWTTGRITWSVWPVLGLSFALSNRGMRTWLSTGSLRERMLARELDAMRRNDR